MAKLKGPLFSLGAAGKLGDALVFFGWKGLNVVREYVVPSNPRTTLQTTQRSYMTDGVTRIHNSQQEAANPFNGDDAAGYALWGSTFPTPRTWFNQCIKNFIDQKVAGLTGIVYRNRVVTPGANQLYIGLNMYGTEVTAGAFRYGTSKTALIGSKVATCLAGSVTATITGLTTGVKYFIQLVPSAPAGAVGAKSGIYYGRPT